MGDHKPNPKLLEQYFFPALLAIILIIVLAAIFTGGDEYDSSATLETNRRAVNGGRVVTRDWCSIEVEALNKKTARKYNISEGIRGVIITEIEGARDVKMKLREGDVICALNGEPIKSVRAFRKESRKIDPQAGMLLDINRAGYQMFVPISGKGGAYNARSGQFQQSNRYKITDVAPFINQDMNLGGYNPPSGVAGGGIENWINQNFGGKYHACLTCGTLLPYTGGKKKKTVLCPNCRNKMVLK